MYEDFIPFELEVKLKEKGLNIPFFFFYRTDEDGKFIHHALVTNPLVYSDKIDDEVVIAPTISQVLKWLRKEKMIHIVINIWGRTWGYDILTLPSGNSLHWTAYDEKINSYEQAALAGIEYVLDNKLI